MRQWIRRVLGHGSAESPPQGDVINNAVRAALVGDLRVFVRLRAPAAAEPQLEPARGAPAEPPEEAWPSQLAEEELALQAALDRACSEVTDAELELATERAELRGFDVRFAHKLATSLAGLARANAALAAAEAALRPRDDDAQRAAREAEQRAHNVEQEADAAVGQAPAKPFIATDEIKRAYRATAKLWHPDLAIEDDDRDARDHAMAALNDAYGRADLDAIRALITDGAPLNQPARTGSIKVTRLRAALAARTRRLAALRSELAELRADENCEPYQRDLTARRDGRVPRRN
jgi:hypothetical protein